MSSYNMNSFISDFAKRTKRNLDVINYLTSTIDYYYVDKDKKNRKRKKKRIFEVTQLINSFLGLIILPNEKFKNSKKKKIKKFRANNKEVDEMMSDVENRVMELLNNCEGGYVNSYEVLQKDDVIFNLCRHLRNSVAHRGVHFYPLVKCDKIEGIIFYESNYGCHKLNKDTENDIKEKIIEKIKEKNIIGEDLLEGIKKEIEAEIEDAHSNAKEFCLNLNIKEVTVLAISIAKFYSCLESLEEPNQEYGRWINSLRYLLQFGPKEVTVAEQMENPSVPKTPN